MIGESKKIKTKDELELNLTVLENGSPVWIIVTHGLGEHSGRHEYFDKIFSQYFNICRWDLRGHGKSGGKKSYVENFSKYVEDLDSVIAFLKDNYKMNRHMLFAHSMGSLVTASYLQKKVSDKNYPEKVFLSGPPVAGPGVLGKMFEIAPLGFSSALGNLNQSIALGGMLDIKKLSHDTRVYDNYIKDPLNSLKIHSRLFFNILAEARDVFSKPLRVSCPLFVALAGEDKLINPNSALEYFSKIEKNAKVVTIENGYHELHNEIEKFRSPYFKFLKESLLETN